MPPELECQPLVSLGTLRRERNRGGSERQGKELPGKVCDVSGLAEPGAWLHSGLRNWRAALAFPNVLTAGTRHRIRRALLFHGSPTNRTVFLPHNCTCLLSWDQFGTSANWRGLPVPNLSNVRSPFALGAMGIEASEPVARMGGLCKFGTNRGNKYEGKRDALSQAIAGASG
jgi:hypothetical protein